MLGGVMFSTGGTSSALRVETENAQPLPSSLRPPLPDNGIGDYCYNPARGRCELPGLALGGIATVPTRLRPASSPPGWYSEAHFSRTTSGN